MTSPRGTVVPRGASAAILRVLALGEQSVGGLVEATGLSQPNVSNHLARLRDRGLVSRRRDGRQILYQIASAGLGHLILAHGGDGDLPGQGDRVQRAADGFLAAVLTHRDEEAARVIDAALAAGITWREIYLQVFAPTLDEVGRRWERGDLPVAGEHLITGTIIRLLHRLSLTLPVSPSPSAPSALVACVEGDLHTIGSRMVADFLVAQGWRTWYLNGFLPMDHLMEAVRHHLPDAVVLSIATEAGEQPLRVTVDQLNVWRGGRPLPLIVAGGRWFASPREIPGLDLTGTDIDNVTSEMMRRVAAIRSAAG